MHIKQCIFILLFIFSVSLNAEVYKCEDEGAIRYSTTPCGKQLINLDLGDESIEADSIQEERLILPIYPGWVNGWKKSKDLKLQRFFEVVYEPILPTESQKYTRINQQKLTNLPQSMTVQRFAISVEDIIESVCANATIYQPKIAIQQPDEIFYGQYACSLRRDTKQGELGFYKIIRGENSIYMVVIKWAVEPFTIDEGAPLAIVETEHQKKRITTAQAYLKDEVKLCLAGNCL